MTVQVQTSKGLVDRDQLEVIDEIQETSDARVVHTVWKTINNGEEVRRDVSVSILRGMGFDNVKGA
jgi:hypothetical protein